MPMEVNWQNQEQTIIQVNIAAPTTWIEFDQAIDQAVQKAKSISHSVCVVIQPNNVPMPRSDNPIPHLQRVFKLLPDNTGLFIVVMGTLGYFERNILGLIGRFAVNRKLRIATTEANAYKIIADQLGKV